ncbi:MAG: hypothetical protein IB618_02915 [Candidatus Pacearchaeota archaeon]|nr:MAG: hypothetical protein IB618_02915 [Candidatus Pacearchaeota archaeon]
MSLKEIIETVGVLVILGGCTSTGVNRVVIPAKGPLEEKAQYVLECYDQNKNGLCDSYIIKGYNVLPIPITLDEETIPINLASRLKKQGLNVVKTHRNY